MSHLFGQNTSILRRWAHHSNSALPADWLSFVRENASEAMNIQRADPELVSLLRGQANAALMADAIEGKLAVTPESYDDRMKAQRQKRMQQLADNNPFTSGNMTEALEVESLNPELAKRLKREAGIGENGSLALTLTPGKVHQQQAIIRARDARVEALNHNQHRLRRGAVV